MIDFKFDIWSFGNVIALFLCEFVQFGMTPMHMAVMNDSLAVVKCLKDALLARGQNPWEKSFPTGIFYKNYEHFKVFNRSFYEVRLNLFMWFVYNRKPRMTDD